ncbi:uncharacterized protein UV8b_06653 [Ustilaginoidea virens]|uniref:F-box domain-containing protein n=1 Tax=Ustilaginoidea virens TaxID=1159556 RepID=A0A8E5MJT4_USTVR|nr:uncharacterized protein UV8b_06653 [Ustilaginoidea virens]QUC22412.1 hypothetical protein UV8b_06653 [Ustilaginoidea virens]
MADAAQSAPVPAVVLPIQKIPLEVLLRISYHLTTPELGSLRLTCRSIEKSLHTTFVKEFFTQKQFMMTQDSLQAFIDVSRSRLGSHLRYVHIGLDRFPEGVQRPLSDDEKERKYRERYANNFMLWNTGHHRDMLAEAFGNLENLEEIIIRDFNSRRRSRDGMHAEWHSYGFTTTFNETGVSLSQGMAGIWNSGFPYQYCSQVFASVLCALGIAKARPKGIQIMSRNSNHLRDFAFSTPGFLEPSVVPIIQGLEKLHLCIDLAWRCPSMGLSPTQTTTNPDLFIRKFLAHATNLRNLRINEHRSNNTGIAALLDWIVGDPDPPGGPDDELPDLPRPMLSMPQLERLSLGTLVVDAPRLLNVVRKFAPSLKSLELWKVTMIRNMPPDDTRNPPKTIFWTAFLQKLTEIPGLNLWHFKAGMLQQHWVERPVPALVSFKGRGPVREYVGPDWKQFVTDIASLLDVQWPLEPELNGDDDSDSGSQTDSELSE